MVDPHAMPISLPPPPVYLESLQVTEQTLPLQNGATLRLPLGARDVEFLFTMPAFTAPERARFRYQLEGYESKFSLSTFERSARYSHLPPGQYCFRVKARDRDGEWNTPASVTVVVPQYFWETRWF